MRLLGETAPEVEQTLLIQPLGTATTESSREMNRNGIAEPSEFLSSAAISRLGPTLDRCVCHGSIEHSGKICPHLVHGLLDFGELAS